MIFPPFNHPFRHPGAAMLELSDQGAWEGERKMAARLEDLESLSGRPYVEEVDEGKRRLGFGLTTEPRRASTDHTHVPGFGVKEEIAYYCPHEELWIQGSPMGEGYNDISFLAGSAGLKLICRSCGHEVGRIVEVVS